MNDTDTILVVDDTTESLSLLINTLVTAGYQVQTADSGEVAMAATAKTLPDLILLDIRMKRMDGLELLKRLKADHATRPIPVILLSAFADESGWLKGLKMGAVDYITKPFLTEELLARVKSHLTLRRAETTIQASEIRYRRLFECAMDGILIIDADTKAIIDVNPYLMALTGYSYEEFLGKELSEIGPFKDTAAAQASFDELLKKDYVRYENLPLEHHNGKQLHVEFVSNVYLAGTQRVVQCNIRDITNRVVLEKRTALAAQIMTTMNQSKDLSTLVADILKRIKENADIEAVGIRLRVGEGYPYFVTDGFSEHFIEMEGDLCLTKASEEPLREPDGRPILECMCGKILRQKTDPSLPFFTDGGSFFTNNTTTLLASFTEAERMGQSHNQCNREGYESVALIPLRSGDDIIGLIQLNDHRPDCFTLEMIQFYEQLGASIGIAFKEKQAQEAIAMLARFPDENPCPLLRISANGTVLYKNPASEEILDFWHWSEHQMLPPEWLSRIQEILKSHEGCCVELKANEHLYLMTLVPVPSAQYVNIYGMDITEQREAEKNLRQSEKMQAIGLLAGGVAHEFNNQLAIINGFCELLLYKDVIKESEQLKNKVTNIFKAGQRAAELTASLLAYSRAEEVKTKVVNLNVIVKSMQTLLGSTIGEDIDVEFALEPDLQCVEVDPRLISDVIINLTANARDALPAGGHLSIETTNVSRSKEDLAHEGDKDPGRYVCLAVHDNGVGMDEKTKKKVFEPFFTTKPVGKGTGLGLSTVYGVVQKAGGYIQIDSELGRGTTLSIYLPSVEMKNEGDESCLPSAVEERPAGNETILVVEDEQGIRDFVAMALTEVGYNVITAVSAADGLRSMEEKGRVVDLVLTDVVMPGMHGFDFLQELRKQFPTMKAVYMSGYSKELVEQRVGLLSEICVLRKPIALLDLTQTVRRVLDE